MSIKLKCLSIGAWLAVTSAALGQLPALTRVTTGDIAKDRGAFLGAAWADFNNDGLLDVLVCNWNEQTNIFYRNDGNGTFTKITGQDPVRDADSHVGVAIGDYDNDGYVDVAIASGEGANSPRRTILYHNEGDGTLIPVSGGSITNYLGYFGACVFGDYDNDGWLDLFVIDHAPGDQHGVKNFLFHNEGNGLFTTVTNGPVVNDVGVGFYASWADYDNDGFVDLIVINNRLPNSHNFLYHNNHDSTFTRVLTNAVALDAWPSGAEGGAWGDYDNDGLPDLFVTDSAGVRNRLYHNDGQGGFSNVNSGAMLRPPSGGSSFGCAWGDYDNDGYLDLFVTNYGGNNALFHNKGDGTFTQILTGDPIRYSGGNTCAWVDYDNDGFLDLFVTGGEPGPLPNMLFHNEQNTNAWLEVTCLGTVSDRSGIGVKVRARATIGGKTFWQMRELSGVGINNSQPLVAHFGLGDASMVDVLRMEWPSGTVQEWHGVAARQMIRVTEPPRLLASVKSGAPQILLKGARFLRYTIETSTNLVAWLAQADVTITNFNGTAEVKIADTNPSGSATFYRAVSGTAFDAWIRRYAPPGLQSPPNSYLYLRGITYGQGQFVAVGARELYEFDENGMSKTLNQDLVILTSPDGQSWSDHSPGIDYRAALDAGLKIVFGNERYVAVGGNVIVASSNSTTWTAMTISSTEFMTDIAYGNNRFIAVGYGGSIQSSVDGIGWTPAASAVTNNLLKIAYGNGQFVIGGDAGLILTSADGTHWTRRDAQITTGVEQIVFGNKSWVALVGVRDDPDYGRAILTSRDAIDWTYHEIPEGMGDVNYSAIAYGNGQFVMALGIYLPTVCSLYTSPDGISWTRQAGSDAIHDVAFGHDTFVAVGDDGTILRAGRIFDSAITQSR